MRAASLARASSLADASSARRSAPARRGAGDSSGSSSGIARLRRRLSSSPFSTPTLFLRPLPSPPRSSFSRIPIESLDYDRASDNERRKRRRSSRRHNDDDDEDEDGEGEYEDDDFGDGGGERRRSSSSSSSSKRGYSDDSFNDDEDASGLQPDFPPAALPGSQVARLKDLAAQSAARRDFHWRYYKAQSAKSNLLSAVVLACTTAGGTSGLISLTQGVNNANAIPSGGFSGLVPDASMFHGMTSAAAQAAREAAATAAANAAAAAANANSGTNSHTAALLSPVLGYAATLVSGLQNYSKPSTAASR